MNEKTYKRCKAAYNIVNKIFNDLNDCTDLGYVAMKKIKHQDSLPVEIKDIIRRCWKVLDCFSYTLTEEDFMWLSDLEDFLQDNKPKSHG